MRAAYLAGGWATNIGNSYYNLGVEFLLRQLLGEQSVFVVPDIASWIWSSPNAYDVVEDVDVDLWVLSGPSFSPAIVGYERLFNRIRDRCGRVAFVSVGAWATDKSGWGVVADFLHRHRDIIELISTRDQRTYRLSKDLQLPSHSGICGSMYLNDAIHVPDIVRPPYIVLNFGSGEEPDVRADGMEVLITPRRAEQRAERSRRSRLARRLARTLARAPDRRTWSTSVGPYEVVRTRSASFARTSTLVFDRPSTHYWDLPFGYLAIYKSAAMVFTDRVHTTAATLILGGSARYVVTGPRAADGRSLLLDRVGAGDAASRVVQLDLEFVNAEKAAMSSWLAGRLT